MEEAPMNRFALLITIPAALILASCGGSPTETKAKEPEKPPEPVTARVALHQMYLMARTWALDVEVLQLQNIPLKAIPAADGKAGAWRGTFVSQSRRAAKTYNYSVIDDEGLYKGVFGGPEETYTGPRGQASPFNFQALKVDSDAALSTSLEKAQDYIKKNPDKPIHFLLENNKRFPNVTWRVIWGDTISLSNFSVFIDASTGDYLQTMR
jgi:hypothetical protein